VIEAREFIEPARERGMRTYIGVPCSFLTPFINYVIGEPGLRYVSSVNEGDAVATAAGIALAGGRAAVMMQNSGLGNAVSPLTSLTWTFRLPVLVICTHRGAPGVRDEPQHQLMGEITRDLFELMRIPLRGFPDRADAVEPVLDEAVAYMETERRPFALLLQKGAVAPHALDAPTPSAWSGEVEYRTHGFDRRVDERPTRQAALERVVARTPESSAAVIATTGYTGRELFAVADRPNHLYMVGSMGCASSLGLGVALEAPKTEVVVVDGDGAALMRLGNLATVGTYGGGNFTHLILDNEVHDSTGAQHTVSANVRFAGVAADCGYRSVVSGDDPALIDLVCGNPDLPGPRLLHLKIRPGTRAELPRPAMAPEEVAQRMTRHLTARPAVPTPG
jgi:phosphonopyruvate decarboxylase